MFMENWKNRIENKVEDYLNSEVFYINIGTGTQTVTVDDTDLQYKSEELNKVEQDRNYDTDDNILLLTFYLATTEFNLLPYTREETQDAEVQFGGTYKVAIKFVPEYTTKINKIKFNLRFVSGTEGDIAIEIQEDNEGEPSGTAITNGTATISSFTTTSFDWKEAVFTNKPQVTEGNTYWIVLSSSGASDNAYAIGQNSAGANEDLKYDGATWTTTTKLNYKIYITHFTEVGLYTSDSLFIARDVIDPLPKDENYEYLFDYEITYNTRINV